jgi:hypothetical protein
MTFDASTHRARKTSVIKMQLQGEFCPPNSVAQVTTEGAAAMVLRSGDEIHRVLTKAIPGDHGLQEETSQSGFLISVETTPFDMSGATKKGFAPLPMIVALFAAASHCFS